MVIPAHAPVQALGVDGSQSEDYIMCMSFHWIASCCLNTLLLGNPTEPLCSRVYRGPRWGWYLVAMDLLFWEMDHCARIHREWLHLKRNPQISRF